MTVSPLQPRRAAPAAFDDFYREHYVRVRVLIARHFPACDAEEIAQETMARCFARYGELDHTRDAWPWVSMIARNAAIDAMRRGRRTVSSEDLPERAGEDETYESVVVSERVRSVRHALSRLRPADRQLIEAHDLAGIGCAEIAAVRDVTQNTLRQQLFRARTRLAAELRKVGAALGTAPVSLRARLAEVARRVDDVAPALPAMSAWAVTGIAGVAAAVGLFGGPGRDAVPAAATVSPGSTVTQADPGDLRDTVAERRAPVPAAEDAFRWSPPGRPGKAPDPLIPPVHPYVSSGGNHVEDPEGDWYVDVVVPTPLGYDVEYHHHMGGFPGYTTVCTAVDAVTCPGEPPPPGQPARDG